MDLKNKNIMIDNNNFNYKINNKKPIRLDNTVSKNKNLNLLTATTHHLNTQIKKRLLNLKNNKTVYKRNKDLKTRHNLFQEDGFYKYYNVINNNNKFNNQWYKKFNFVSNEIRFTNVRSISLYNAPAIDKLLGHFIKKGKRSIAEKIFYDVVLFLRKETKDNPLKIFYNILKKNRIFMDVKVLKRSGRKLDLPKFIKTHRRYFNAIKWLIKTIESRKEYGNIFTKKLSLELLNIMDSKRSTSYKRLLRIRILKGRINQRYTRRKKRFNKKKSWEEIIKETLTYYKTTKKKNNIEIDLKKSLNILQGPYIKKLI